MKRQVNVTRVSGGAHTETCAQGSKNQVGEEPPARPPSFPTRRDRPGVLPSSLPLPSGLLPARPASQWLQPTSDSGLPTGAPATGHPPPPPPPKALMREEKPPGRQGRGAEGTGGASSTGSAPQGHCTLPGHHGRDRQGPGLGTRSGQLPQRPLAHSGSGSPSGFDKVGRAPLEPWLDQP